MEIGGNTFLVTGGSSGLGEATARMLVDYGGNVVIADINAYAGEMAAASLGNGARLVGTDVTDEDSVQRAVDTAREVYGGLHGLVNCAGLAAPERVLTRQGPQALRSFARIIEVNLIGTFNVIRLAAAAMAKGEPNRSGERGIIINTASIAAFEGQVGQASYSASKAGVAAMALPIAREFARFGIRVNTIAPRIFDTPMLKELTDDARRSLEREVPFPPRLGRPDEYASLVRHIIENEMLNGEIIRLDGAMRLSAG